MNSFYARQTQARDCKTDEARCSANVSTQVVEPLVERLIIPTPVPSPVLSESVLITPNIYSASKTVEGYLVESMQCNARLGELSSNQPIHEGHHFIPRQQDKRTAGKA
ncbi:hypothetical protein BJY00DRAFT_152993 [Aspergillus carlsbadensis]|nr:hypothetical protein BJY00DRAFT_152993 [Aspergillus carlsbadensis]